VSQPAVRRELPDALRGFSLCSMILYHGMWDLVFLGGIQAPWYTALPGFLWQQSICWCFILLSGYCHPLGRRHWRRGLLLLACGALIRAATSAVLPEAPIRFGVLTLLGACTLLLRLLRPAAEKLPPAVGLGCSAALFALTYRIPQGLLLGSALPRTLYRSQLTAFLGFPPAGFVSSDYFPLVPWFFLFCAGAFFFRLREGRPPVQIPRIPVLSWMGRHSLLIYLLHQPALYGLGMLANLF